MDWAWISNTKNMTSNAEGGSKVDILVQQYVEAGLIDIPEGKVSIRCVAGFVETDKPSEWKKCIQREQPDLPLE